MRLSPLPPEASWTHRGVRDGFEVVFLRSAGDGHRLVGHTTANEESVLWSVGYDVTLDAAWRTVAVHATTLTAAGGREVALTRDAADRWVVDGEPRPDLDGCADVDFESSAVTNTFPIHRLDLVEGKAFDVSSAFVRADDLRVERLDQTYTLIARSDEGLTLHYESPTFEFVCDLIYDGAGLIVDYPGIAVRDL
ncbi:putative glycolipid-binding domain-containing protein [Microbacterium sp. EST19A]|uniref:putative glycolipid-binding domain-containing protein n=1 Tax=Microbacterium sp. EST19A TaxID=2862681 RepID=UPI001CBB3D5A|nr:putative glycolipid-binding domain-containing protein [Microbacterium sp. EST19A]